MPASPTRRGLVGALVVLAGLALASPAPAQESEFQKTQLVDTTLNPMEIEVAPDGRVFYTERRGVVGVWDPETESSREIGTVPVTTFQENGLLGIALAPDFSDSGWIYLSYSALPLESLTQRLSRFQLDENGDLDMSSEQPIFEWTHLRETCCHSAGALEFDPDGNLLISTGDNTNPFDSNGYAPIDERDGRESWDAQRTAANTNDHNGKLLRISPLELIPPGTEPGIGQTYGIPEGNMFPLGTEDTLPEIYAMGFRNPFRFKIDEETGWALLSDYGPDAGAANPDRGPQGSVEYNVITEPGNFGWPYCVRATVPYIDGDFVPGGAPNEFVSSGVPFDCEAPENTSPNNTGLTDLPPVEPATMWAGYTETDPRVPGLGPGGAPMAGPRYYFDPSNPSPTKFPEEFDGKWFIGEWNNDWIKTVELDEDGNASNVEDFADLGYQSPMDMEFGPDGSLYLAEWGQGFGQDHPESGIYRIDHVELTGPQVEASADPERGTVPLEVAFDGEATNPDGSPNPNFEYEWDFGDGTPTSSEADPTHTYTEVGTYTATLTVTDPETSEEGTDSVEIQVDPEDSCPTGPLSDEFDGTEIDPKWSIIRPDGTRPPTVGDGELHFPIDNGSIYGAGTSARNIMVEPLPDGDVAVTAKIEVDELSENYHQAGLRVYSDDDNWASVHMIHAGGARDFEFIWEANGNPRNEAADKLGGIPADAPLEYYVRLVSDGDELTAFYSYDGEEFLPVGRPASLETFDNPRIGPVALSDAASTYPVAHFDWIRFDPDASGGGGGGETDVDEFDGTELDTDRWNAILNENPETYEVADGLLTITTEPGDIYTGDTVPPPNNFILQSADHAAADWTIETKVLGGALDGGYSQGGLIALEDTDNYVKFDLISDQDQTAVNRIELRSEVGAAIQEPQPQVTPLPAGTEDAWLRLTKEGTTYTGEYSFDGETWESIGAAVANPMAAPNFGLFAIGVQQGGDDVPFEYFTLEGAGCPAEGEPPEISSVSADPTGGFAPLDVDFDVAASDPDGDELTYEWDFGDGSATSDEQSPTHTYTEPGEYEAEVTVSDGENQTSDSVTVTVLAEDDPEASFRTLVFSKTAGFRHSSIDEGHAALDTLADENGFQVDHTEDASLFTPGILSHYDAVTFLSTTGDVLNEGQEDAFEAYIQGGGGYVGIHSASDTEYEWNWYGHLVGGYFRNHPPGTANAAIDVEDQEHPSTAGLPARYERVDEWYNLKSPDFAEVGDDDYTPRPNVHVLATVDESTYDEQDGNATDDDHPVTWCQRYDGGFSWYTAMGHTEASYTEPNFLAQVLGGLETTAGVEPNEACGFQGAAALRLRVDPKSRSAKVGKEVTFTANTRNNGEAAASEVEVCVKAPEQKVNVVGQECVSADSLPAGERMSPKFNLKPKRSARGDKVKITFTAKAAGVEKEKDEATLKVRR
jgi:PKD repeat protein/glucose/arabinose dehydrogenase